MRKIILMLGIITLSLNVHAQDTDDADASPEQLNKALDDVNKYNPLPISHDAIQHSIDENKKMIDEDNSNTNTSNRSPDNTNSTTSDDDNSRGRSPIYFYISKKIAHNTISVYKVMGSKDLGLKNNAKECRTVSVKWNKNAQPYNYSIPPHKTLIIKRRSAVAAIVDEKMCK